MDLSSWGIAIILDLHMVVRAMNIDDVGGAGRFVCRREWVDLGRGCGVVGMMGIMPEGRI
jgi:hypothetical protein